MRGCEVPKYNQAARRWVILRKRKPTILSLQSLRLSQRGGAEKARLSKLAQRKVLCGAFNLYGDLSHVAIVINPRDSF